MSIAQVTKKSLFARTLCPVLLVLFLAPVQLNAQDNLTQYQRSFLNGIQLFRDSQMFQAAASFRHAQEIAGNADDWARATYWVILSQLAIADFSSAIMDMNDLERFAPDTGYAAEMTFHRARAYFNLGFFEEALILFQRYIDNTPYNEENAGRIAAAYFWIGESLFALGHFEDAERFYAWVVTRFPGSPRVEAANHRMDLIRHRRIEAELLALLRWSHEESLRNSEEFQRRMRTYEHTLNLYQLRIAELTQEMQRIAAAAPPPPPVVVEPPPPPVPDPQDNLLERARLLGINIQRLIDDHEHVGGTW